MAPEPYEGGGALIAPRYRSVPPAAASRAAEARDFASAYGIVLDPWQWEPLEASLGVRPDGRWSAFEVATVVSRQNGKGTILEARELLGAFVFGERLIIHSAHLFDTSMEAFLRMEERLEETGLDRELRPRGGISRSHGAEGFTFRNGVRIRYRTRTKGGGRGFSADLLVLDEAMVLNEMMMGALVPTLSARPNPQIWYAGSAVDQLIHEHGVVLARIRERGLRGDDPSLAYLEWSALVREEDPERAGPEVLDDEANWAAANPALGIRIFPEHVRNERRSLGARTFAVERLGIGDWPPTEQVSGQVRVENWLALTDPDSKIAGPVAFGLDVAGDRSWSAISAAGERDDGSVHLELVDYRRGTGWLVDRAVELNAKWSPSAFVVNGPGAAFSEKLRNEGLPVRELAGAEYAAACGNLVDRVEERRLRHLGSPELTAAIRGAGTRSLGDAWAWSRRASKGDISPLVSATLAAFAVEDPAGSIYDLPVAA